MAHVFFWWPLSSVCSGENHLKMMNSWWFIQKKRDPLLKTKLSNNFDVGIPKDRRFESLSRNTPFPVAICSLNNTRYIVKTCKNRIKFQVCSNSSTVFFLSWTVEIIMSHVWTKSLPGGEPLQKGLAVHHCQRKISGTHEIGALLGFRSQLAKWRKAWYAHISQLKKLLIFWKM